MDYKICVNGVLPFDGIYRGMYTIGTRGKCYMHDYHMIPVVDSLTIRF